jgi:ABC-type polysaccharide/polyol phosphate transport system ATPase subunit
MSLIEFDNVSKSFSHAGGGRLLRDHLSHFLLRRQRSDVFWALKHVTFQLEHGESMAIVGGNGAGKSTLLSLVAGLSEPNEGTVKVNGRVAALLELGSGFQGDLTGRENVLLNASLLGLSRQDTYSRFDEIIDFSGISDFIDEPLRTYSSGMVMRLAFSVAVHVDPDVLLVDEVLAVGDESFQAKCRERIQQFKRMGKTLLFVSHAQAQVKDFCDTCIWLDHGEMLMKGSPDEVLAAYSGKAVK